MLGLMFQLATPLTCSSLSVRQAHTQDSRCTPWHRRPRPHCVLQALAASCAACVRPDPDADGGSAERSQVDDAGTDRCSARSRVMLPAKMSAVADRSGLRPLRIATEPRIAGAIHRPLLDLENGLIHQVHVGAQTLIGADFGHHHAGRIPLLKSKRSCIHRYAASTDSKRTVAHPIGALAISCTVSFSEPLASFMSHRKYRSNSFLVA